MSSMGSERVSPADPSSSAKPMPSSAGSSCFGGGPVVKRTARDVLANQSELAAPHEFCNNEVITARYTWWDFLPRFLFEQFSRFANFYFLIVCILQSITTVSITDGVPTSAMPLAAVIGFDALITAREDYLRHCDDATANSKKVLTVRPGGGGAGGGKSFQPVQWRDLRVGDVIKVQNGEEFPADLVFLAAENPEPDLRGVCHVQTAQLDGETNLKMRNAPDRAVAAFRSEEAISTFRGKVTCEEPHENFAKFNGTLSLLAASSSSSASASAAASSRHVEDPAAAAAAAAAVSRPIALDANNTLLRGCVLKNALAIYGLVVYTGRETKVRVKQTKVSTKKASVEADINLYIVALLIIQILMCAGGAIGFKIWDTTYAAKSWYLDTKGSSSADVVARFFTFFLLISNIIPISLYVTMKMARTAQKIFMDRDAECVYVDAELFRKSGGEEGTYPLKVRSMDLNDELGQISHIFSDKTGTLTDNYMDFRKMTISGISYGRGITDIGIARRRRLGMDTTEVEALTELAAEAQAAHPTPHVNYLDGSESHPGHQLLGPEGDIARDGGIAGGKNPLALQIRLFLLNLALNHTVVLETVKDKKTGAPRQQLSASSPDEEAFVLAATLCGVQFKSRDKDVVTLTVDGVDQTYRVVVILPYSSARQMMSIIVEDLNVPESSPMRFILFAKGSDARMFQLNVTATLGKRPGGSPPDAATVESQLALIEATKVHLRDMAEDGLRTLAFSYRVLPAAKLAPWQVRYEAALSDMTEKRARDEKLPNKIDSTAAELECDLLFQGATANEDKLQAGVPDAIANLGYAGIKIYMLTGDKQETAINIGFATRMITNDFSRIIITSEELFGDSLKARVSAEKKAALQAAIAASGGDAAAYTESQKKQPLPLSDTVLELNTARKLRLYSNLVRQKTACKIAFSRPRALVVDELVMNMVWPTEPPPLLARATLANFRDLYKEVASSVARARAIIAGISGKEYFGYTDSDWASSEYDAKQVDEATTLSIKIRADSFKASLLACLQKQNFSAFLAEKASDSTALAEGKEIARTLLYPPQSALNSNWDPVPASASPLISSLIYAEGLASAEALFMELLRVGSSASETDIAALGAVMSCIYQASNALHFELAHSLRADLLVMAESSRAVICCRCRPDQKRRMLLLIKENVPSSRCLAIGDGANDVEMIQAAHVGCGIIGPEGVQAANSSDYSMGRFRFLQRLLLVHGRFNYMRMALLVCYMYYKNILYALTQMLFTIVAAWSGQKFYVEAASQTFNVIYTGLPIILHAIYDKDVSAERATRFPFLYRDGTKREFLNIMSLLRWMATAIVESILIFVFVVYGSTHAGSHGATPYIFEMGTWVFTAIVVISNVRLFLNTHLHTWLFILVTVGSIAIWWPAAYIFDYLNSNLMSGGMTTIYSSGGFWLWLLCITVATQTPAIFATLYRTTFHPSYRHLVQESQVFLTPVEAANVEEAARTAAIDGVYNERMKACCTPFARRSTVRKNMSLKEKMRLISAFEPGLGQDLPFGPRIPEKSAEVGSTGVSASPPPPPGVQLCQEDIDELLVEWPIEQTLNDTLIVKQAQLEAEYAQALREAGALPPRPEIALKKLKATFLKDRVEKLLSDAPKKRTGVSSRISVQISAAASASISTTKIAVAAAPRPAPPHPHPNQGDGGAWGDAAKSAMTTATEVTVAAADNAAGATAAATANPIPIASVVSIDSGATSATVETQRTLPTVASFSMSLPTDTFSVDPRSSEHYGAIFSTVGRSGSKHLGSKTTVRPFTPVESTVGAGLSAPPVQVVHEESRNSSS